MPWRHRQIHHLTNHTWLYWRHGSAYCITPHMNVINIIELIVVFVNTRQIISCNICDSRLVLDSEVVVCQFSTPSLRGCIDLGSLRGTSMGCFSKHITLVAIVQVSVTAISDFSLWVLYPCSVLEVFLLANALGRFFIWSSNWYKNPPNPVLQASTSI